MVKVFQLCWFLLIALFSSPLIGQLARAEEPLSLSSPGSKRTEGRVTLEYFKNDEKIKTHLAFSEVIDSDLKRSKVTIGYVSHEPTVFYSRDNTILMVDKKAGCVNLKEMNHFFVPDLDRFLKLSYTQEEMEKGIRADRRHHIGPSGVSLMISKSVSSSTQVTISGSANNYKMKKKSKRGLPY